MHSHYRDIIMFWQIQHLTDLEAFSLEIQRYIRLIDIGITTTSVTFSMRQNNDRRYPSWFGPSWLSLGLEKVQGNSFYSSVSIRGKHVRGVRSKPGTDSRGGRYANE